MSVRFDAFGESYSGVSGLPVDTYTLTMWVMSVVDRNQQVWPVFLEGAVQHGWRTDSDGTTLRYRIDSVGWGAGIALTPGTWFFLAAAMNGGFGGTTWIGALGQPLVVQAITSSAPSIGVCTALWVGSQAAGAGWVDGRVAALKMWDTPLSASEVDRERAFTAPQRVAGLTRWHPFNVASGLDESGRGNHLAGGVGASAEDGPPIPFSSTPVLVRRPSVRYEVVAVERLPQADAPPTLSEIGPVPWTSLSWSEDVSGAATAQVGFRPAACAREVRAAFRDLAERGLELWVHRDGRRVHAGPVVGWQARGEAVTVNSWGLLDYLRYAYLRQTLTFTGVDQFTIARTLIDHWDVTLLYGDFGLVTSGIGLSGVLRDRTYVEEERHVVFDRLMELSRVENGFDSAVDPVSRAVMLHYPRRGVDRSGSVVLDRRALRSANITFSVAPGDFATVVEGVGTSGVSGPLIAEFGDPNGAQSWGHAGYIASFDGVSTAATLADRTASALLARTRGLIVPGGEAVPVADFGVDDFGVGDTIGYTDDAGFGLVTLAPRVVRRTVSVRDDTETMAVEVG